MYRSQSYTQQIHIIHEYQRFELNKLVRPRFSVNGVVCRRASEDERKANEAKREDTMLKTKNMQYKKKSRNLHTKSAQNI